MKTLLCLCAAVMLALSPMTAKAAADVTGTWVGEMKAPDGSGGFQLSFNLKQDGDKLTGTVSGGQGDPMPITNGKVEGSKISFTVTVGDNMVITHEGTINDAGDEIKMVSKSDQGMGGDFTLKRSK